jgi:type IV pilus assembly protein PilE
MKRASNNGFTLVELMIAIVIMAILVGLAYPAYQGYTRQARRADAQAGLMRVATQLEKFFTYCNTYPAVATTTASTTPLTQGWPTSCPANPPSTTVGLGMSALSPDSYYEITIAAGATTGSCSGAGAGPNCGYTITANPNGASVPAGKRLQLNDGAFRLDSLGNKAWDENNNGNFTDTGENDWKKG